jgi:hypothetical protein
MNWSGGESESGSEEEWVGGRARMRMRMWATASGDMVGGEDAGYARCRSLVLGRHEGEALCMSGIWGLDELWRPTRTMESLRRMRTSAMRVRVGR